MREECYIMSESTVYTPFDIQEGNHHNDENLGCTIRIDYDLLPEALKEDEILVAEAIFDWFNSMKPVEKPEWILT